MKQIDGMAEAADTISRFVLPTSVTIAPGARYAGNSTSRATFASTGAARTTTSAPVTLAVLSPASIDTISTRGHLRAAALAIDPPIRPTPTIAIRLTQAYPRGFAPRTPLHALSRAASPARSVRVARSLPLTRSRPSTRLDAPAAAGDR